MHLLQPANFFNSFAVKGRHEHVPIAKKTNSKGDGWRQAEAMSAIVCSSIRTSLRWASSKTENLMGFAAVHDAFPKGSDHDYCRRAGDKPGQTRDPSALLAFCHNVSFRNFLKETWCLQPGHEYRVKHHWYYATCTWTSKHAPNNCSVVSSLSKFCDRQ